MYSKTEIQLTNVLDRFVGRHQKVHKGTPVAYVRAFGDNMLNRLSLCSAVTSCTCSSIYIRFQHWAEQTSLHSYS